MQITYQKNNGCIFKRLRNTQLPYKIGETTSMGWKVLNIEYEYNNKFYSEYLYHKIRHKQIQTLANRKQTIDICKREFKTFIYCLLSILLLNFLKSILGI